MKRHDAFTLTELLVLVPIATLVGALLLASLDDAKQKLQASQCLNNMRQWGLAIGMYANDYNDYIVWTGTSSGIDVGFNLTAWFNVLPHYINQTPLKDLYNSSPPNIPLPGKRSIYVCPSLTTPGTDWTPPASVDNPWFGYAMNRVNSGNSDKVYKRSKAALPSKVILLSESENNSFPFTDGYHLVNDSGLGQIPPRHSGGMNFVFLDGHAQWYSLTDYKRSNSECGGSSGADIEWSKPYKLFWWPCGDPVTCNKS